MWPLLLTQRAKISIESNSSAVKRPVELNMRSLQGGKMLPDMLWNGHALLCKSRRGPLKIAGIPDNDIVDEGTVEAQIERYITKSGDFAIVFSVLADELAAVPTVVKAFNYPETEIGWTYFMSTISAAITLLTIKVWDVANAACPLYIVLITLVISTLVQFKLGKRMKAQLKIS